MYLQRDVFRKRTSDIQASRNARADKVQGTSSTGNVRTANYAYPVVSPGQRSYSSVTEYGRKICVIGDSHLNRIKKKSFNNSLSNGKVYLNVFRGSTINRIKHFVQPTLVEDKPDAIIIHVGCNDITRNSMDTADPTKIAESIIDIGKLCAYHGVQDVIMSSILPKRNIRLTKIIRQVNDKLKEMCQVNNFGFICNDNISRNLLWIDGIHYTDEGTNILVRNYIEFLNDYVLNDRNFYDRNDRIWLGTVDSSKQISVVSDEKTSDTSFFSGYMGSSEKSIHADDENNKKIGEENCVNKNPKNFDISILDNLRIKNVD